MMLEAHNLVKRYDGVLAIDHVSMEVRRGPKSSVPWSNGAGSRPP